MLNVHLTASRFYGGPERLMLGLAKALPPSYRSMFVSFREDGCCHPFLDEARRVGFESRALHYDAPRYWSAMREIERLLKRVGAEALCCHGYKSIVLGRIAARRAGIPVMAVSHGWTTETLLVRFYELLDRAALRRMDHVICVSRRQAERVREARVAPEKVTIIPNAVHAERFDGRDHEGRARLQTYFAEPCRAIVGAAGRLSPEKGFEVLIEAARRVIQRDRTIGFVLFGDGPLREPLETKIRAANLGDRFVLAGFRNDLERFLPYLDLFAQSSFTEGMPTVILEACAAGVPVVATAVGGTPEIIEDGVHGRLVEPGDAAGLAEGILGLLNRPEARELAENARRRVLCDFSFSAQGLKFQEVLQRLRRSRLHGHSTGTPVSAKGALG